MRGHTGVSHNNPGHHCDIKMLKYLILAMILTGCASMDQMVCYGTGTCSATDSYSATARWVSPLPQSIVTSQGTFIITRDQSSGAINNINQVSRGK